MHFKALSLWRLRHPLYHGVGGWLWLYIWLWLLVVLVIWLWLCMWLLIVDEQHSKALLSRRLGDYLCHVIAVHWFSMWLLVVVDEVVSCCGCGCL